MHASTLTAMRKVTLAQLLFNGANLIFRRIVTIAVLVLVLWGIDGYPATAADPGWGLIVNRTKTTVHLNLTNSQNVKSIRHLRSGQALPLRRSGAYTVSISHSNINTTVDARRIGLEIVEPLWYPSLVPVHPSWKLMDPQEDVEVPTRTAWETRWYQLRTVGNQTELHQGFTDAEVHSVVARYRKEMDAIGFVDSDVPVYRFFEPPFFPDETEAQAAKLLREAGITARKRQHSALGDAMLDLIRSGASDMGRSPEMMEVACAEEEFAFYVGDGELRELAKTWDWDEQEVLQFKAVAIISGSNISPEIHNFVQRVVAKVLGFASDEIAVAVNPHVAVPCAPSPIAPIRDNSGKPAPQLVRSEVYRAINEQSFLKALPWPLNPSFHKPQKSTDAGLRPIWIITLKQGWRYHGETDRVRFMEDSPWAAKMHLRWRLAIECQIWDREDGSPQLQVAVKIEYETKGINGSLKDYRAWPGLSFDTYISPIGTDQTIKLSDVAYELQQAIFDRCTIK